MGLFEYCTDSCGECVKKTIASHNSQRIHEGQTSNLLILANAGLVGGETWPGHQGKREDQKARLWCGFSSPIVPPFLARFLLAC